MTSLNMAVLLTFNSKSDAPFPILTKVRLENQDKVSSLFPRTMESVS